MNENVKNNNEKKKNAGGKLVYYILIFIVVIAACYMIFKRLTFKKEVDFNAVPSVNVTHIRRGTISKSISVMGNILPTDTYYVVSKVGGDIKDIYVKNGDYVKKGDPICEIDASKEIEAAFIQYDTAKSSYERMQKLYQAGDISLQSFEQVKAQYDGYKLAYDTKVEYSTPVAVDNGVVENTNMTINTSINQGTILCYITSEGAKEINFGVTERVLEGLNINDPVTIEKSGKTYDGYVSNISNLINSQNGLFNVKAVITSENTFASGVMAKVTFPYITRKNVNILSNELIYYEASMPYVFTVNDDGLVTKKYIEVGIENEDYTEIITNLSKSLKIISTWNNDLAEGATVNVVKDEKVEDELYIESVSAKVFEEKNKETIKKSTSSNIVENEDTVDTDESEQETSEFERIISYFDKDSDDTASVSEAKETIEETKGEKKEEALDKPSFTDKGIDSGSLKITEVK